MIAFEPQPRLAARLMDVFTWRGWVHVCVEQKGLSSKPGVFSVKRVAAIKIDVVGHELQVFEGGRRVLELDRPLLMFESEARHHTQGRTTFCFGRVR